MKIGLEVHVYPDTDSKMYCSCSVDHNEPNDNICPICTGQPGAKPMATNKKALELGVKIAKSLNCDLVEDLVHTNRKHYFYPDLPNNFQRTSEPFAVNGSFENVGITEIHWEEDPGKYNLKKKTVDFNRSGTPLLEIVTEPDIKSPEQAKEFLKELKSVLSYLKASTQMFKVDTNISMSSERVEIKNIGSIRGVELALKNEARRQKRIIKKGEDVKRETRGYDESTGKTKTLRKKEQAADYRYMKDPDIPPIKIDTTIEVPKPLKEVRTELQEDYNLDEETVRTITRERELLDLFRETKDIDSDFAANFIKNDLVGELSYRDITFEESNLDFNDVKALLEELREGKLTDIQGTEKLRAMLDGEEFKKEEFSRDEVDNVIKTVLNENQSVVEKYKNGETAVINFLLGQCLKKLKGSIEANDLREKIENLLS